MLFLCGGMPLGNVVTPHAVCQLAGWKGTMVVQIKAGRPGSTKHCTNALSESEL
jgi:hypothetical protein